MKQTTRVLDYDDFDQWKLERFFDDEYDEDDHAKGRVFYSHSMMVYGTDYEQVEKKLIREEFADFGIVSLKFYEGDVKKMQDIWIDYLKGTMEKT